MSEKQSTPCCDLPPLAGDEKVFALENKILLMGNPNVGKSVIFSALSGVHVMSSNYAGTTVSYTNAKVHLGDRSYALIDVPGTYALHATSEAEQVAVSFMESGAKVVICVLDATNLTRNLNLAQEIRAYGIPIVYLLNLSDVAERKGIVIDKEALSRALMAPVIETVATKGVGLDELKSTISKLYTSPAPLAIPAPTTQKELWAVSEGIAKECVTTTQAKEPSKLDKLGEKMIIPKTGVPIAILTMLIALCAIVFGGKGLRTVVFIPLINNGLVPILVSLVNLIPLPEIVNNVLVGDCGILVIGFEWIFSLILPYVALFYVVFTFLEDCGFLPRMAVLFDNVMRKMGVQGGSLITLVMGYGCAVPAIIGTRNATTQKERIIITSMVCFAVPCISQIGALLGLLSGKFHLILGIFALSFVVIGVVGFIVGKMLQEKIDPIVLELPNLLAPEPKAYRKKLAIRMKSFLVEAEGPMLIAIVIAAVAIETGLMDSLATFFEPFIMTVLGLPGEAVSGLLLGIIRREMTVYSLSGLDLTDLQLFVGATVSLLYLPCLSVFGVIAKEFNAKVALFIGVGTLTSAIALGGLFNFLGQLIGF